MRWMKAWRAFLRDNGRKNSKQGAGGQGYEGGSDTGYFHAYLLVRFDIKSCRLNKLRRDNCAVLFIREGSQCRLQQPGVPDP
jgi:hypothetical protein